MHDATILKAIEGKYIELLDDLDERGGVARPDSTFNPPVIAKSKGVPKRP